VTEVREAHGTLRRVFGALPTATRLPTAPDGRPVAEFNATLLLHRLWVSSARPDLRADHLATVARACKALPDGMLAALHERRRRAMRTLAERQGHEWRSLVLAPVWRLVVGHGEDNVNETGPTMSPVYGLPIVPGSALKGLAAAQARAAHDDGLLTPLLRVFGSPRPEVAADAEQGSVVLLDALPVEPPSLVVDVLTPHVQPYYKIDGGVPSAAPAEYHNPVPVRFLAVEAPTRFRAVLAGPAADVDQVTALLRAAVDDLGLGGKTAAGYGYCTLAEEQP
jgi:CRISPR/Cas system CMR subunit Cmr6 (Cas7 group RAMP superfamily)